MTVELELEIPVGPVRVVPIPSTFTDQLLFAGPGFLCGYSIRDAQGDAGTQVEGQVTSPAAGAVIVTSAALAAGTYDINWTVGLQGTLAAADANNFQLVAGGANVVASINQGVAGNYPQVPARVTVVAGATIQVKAIALGTVGAVYLASVEAIPVNLATSIVELQDGNNPLAELSVAPNSADTRWFSDHGLWIRNRINYHPIAGLLTGALYVRYHRLTG